MKRCGYVATTGVVALLAMGAPAPIAAQEEKSAAVEELSRQFEASAQKLVALARAIPADDYDWSPGEGVASVARVYMHIARYNYMYPHENMLRATPVPTAEYMRWEGGITDKGDVVAILEASMDYVRDVFEDTSARASEQTVTLYGQRVPQRAVLLQLVAHMNEHLGQSIAYARMNGVVPPWSR